MTNVTLHLFVDDNNDSVMARSANKIAATFLKSYCISKTLLQSSYLPSEEIVITHCKVCRTGKKCCLSSTIRVFCYVIYRPLTRTPLIGAWQKCKIFLQLSRKIVIILDRVRHRQESCKYSGRWLNLREMTINLSLCRNISLLFLINIVSYIISSIK